MSLVASRAAAPASPVVSGRVGAVDRVRGLAIACMVVDHLCLIFSGPELLRWTVGRLAMPLFFVLSGYLLRRLSWRHAGIGAVGLVLPAAVVWVDRPNVLVWYAVGAVVLTLLRWAEVSPVVLVVVVLTVMANHGGSRLGSSYEPGALLALMALGQMLKKRAQDPERVFAWGSRLPVFLEGVGRRPLAFYLGHVLVLDLAWDLGYWRV